MHAFLIVVVSIAFTLAEIPPNWRSAGCWSDIPSQRTLNAAYYVDDTYNDQEMCIAFCDLRDYQYAGLEYGRECYCGNEIRNGAKQIHHSDCNMTCSYDEDEYCGAANRLTVFENEGWEDASARESLRKLI